MKIELAIKFGSDEIILFCKGIGIVARQSTYVAVSNQTNKICAFDNDAKKLCDERQDKYKLIQPIKGVEIIDKRLAIELIENILSKSVESKINISALVAVPCAMTEKKLLELKIVLQDAGIRKVDFVQNGTCVRIGEFEFKDSDEVMVVDIGKYLTDISVVSRYKFSFGRDYFIGGEEMDVAVQTYIEDNYDVCITKLMAEKVKREIASLYENDMYTISFDGITKDDSYKNITVRANEIRVAIIGIYDKIFDLIEEVFEVLPSETLAQIKRNGIVFTGGVSCVAGLSEYATQRLGVPVINILNPQDSVILGAGKLLTIPREDYPHINL